MKKTLLNFTRTALALGVLGLMAPLALAWTPPTGSFPAGNVPAPVNTGTVTQTKNSSLNIVGVLNASISTVAGVVAKGTRGMFGCSATLGGCLGVVPSGLFEAGKYNANSSSANLTDGISIGTGGEVAIGKMVSGTLLPSQGLFVGNVLGAMVNRFFGRLDIVLPGSGPVGRNALMLQVSQDNVANGDGAVFQTNADRFSFYNAGSLAAITAKKIRLTEGAAAGKVLVSDASGNGSWGDAAGAMDIIEVHVPKSGGWKASDKCPLSHPIALSGGGGCSVGMLNKVNVSFLGHAGAEGEVTVECRKDPLRAVPDGSVNGVDLICAKAVPGGIYGGMVAGAQTTTTPPPPVSTNQFVAVPASTPNGTPGQSCVAWLLASNVGFNGNTQNVRFMGILGPNPTSTLPSMVGACAYTATIGGTAYCDAADAAAPYVNAAYAPTAKCPTGSKLPVSGLGGANANPAATLSGTTQTR
jgi:hypothetical protein